jgi:hypothetical protein
MGWCRADNRPSGKHLNPNDEQMGSTLFGDVIAADAAGPAAPRHIETDRGIDGRVSGCV